MARRTRVSLASLASPVLAVLALLSPPTRAAGSPASPGLPPAPSGLVCELLTHPQDALIAEPKPRFGWVVPSTGQDVTQAAYQIVVAGSESDAAAGRGGLWDSGRVAGPQSIGVPYAGRPLESNRSYWWAVRTWDDRGAGGAYSPPQRFNTGVLGAPAPPSCSNEMTQALLDGKPRWLWEGRDPLEVVEVEPARVDRLGPGRALVDFGCDAFGTLRLTLPAGAVARETVAAVQLGEKLASSGAVDAKPPGSVAYRRVELKLLPGKEVYTIALDTPPQHRKDPAVRMPANVGEVMPFRYAQVEGLPVDLDKGMARQLAVRTVFDESASEFESSDANLNAVWALCRRTMKATSYLGVFVDGQRERIAYEADAYINQLGDYAADRQFMLARHTIEHLLKYPTWPTEWSFHVVMCAHADWLYTGDTGLIRRHYAELKRKLLGDKARPDGLVRACGIVDWPAAERDGYGQGKPDPKDARQVGPEVNTVVNAFSCHCLGLMAEMAGAIGEQADAADYRAKAARATAALNDRLFDPSRGVYVDGEGSAHASLHANVFPLAFGLVPPERKAKVAAFVGSRGMACSVYAAQYLLDALYQADAPGAPEAALALMTARSDRSWLHMIDLGSTLTLEAWDARYKKNLTWNHAWGAAPGNIVPRRLMGVRPLEAGFGLMEIRPQPGGLKWARLKLPTIRGTVLVRFEEGENPAGFVLDVELPANTAARVVLPRRGAGKVDLDGKPAEAAAEGDRLVIARLGSGRHRVSIR